MNKRVKLAYRSSSLLIFIGITSINSLCAQLKDCTSKLLGDTLVIENNVIRRRFLWRNGGLAHLDLLNKYTHQLLNAKTVSATADFIIPGEDGTVNEGSFKVYIVPKTASTASYLATEIITKDSLLQWKRVFKIFPNCPVVVCDMYLKGKSAKWENAYRKELSMSLPSDERMHPYIDTNIFIIDKIGITGSNWKLKSIEFFDVTDDNNSLVQPYEKMLYRNDVKMRGNVLLANSIDNGAGFFILKEAPVSTIQLYYHGFDFKARIGEINTVGSGISPSNLSDTAWIQGYSTVLGVGVDNSEQGLLLGLRAYQQLQRTIIPSRDEMIIANTWGDRSQDSRVNEAFILNEIDAAAKLGITHLQIDDGWQKGRSANSIIAKGSLEKIWHTSDYWIPDTDKFPNGFKTVVNHAKSKGVSLSLWFNPSSDNSYENWEKDADVLIEIYKVYGIYMWKIDGVLITDKIAEINFKKLLDKVTTATNHQAVFNLDVTAGKRGGYFSYPQYGNIFLENRYTDWGNYYPYSTLRNLWQLSKYTPPQRFQIEFLNKWRNTNKYDSLDVLAPINYSFNYLFAITMVAQPLAWCELSSLPKEAFLTSHLIKQYKLFRNNLHSGKIFPIGEEPDGYNYTGFQSMLKDSGYFLIFRELNQSPSKSIKTWLKSGTKLRLIPLIGNASISKIIKVNQNQTINFQVAEKNNFVLYKYVINK